MAKGFWTLDPGRGYGAIDFGTPSAEIVRRLREEKVAFRTEGDDPTWIVVDDPDVELVCEDDPPHRLIEITSRDPASSIEGQRLLGERLPFALKVCRADRLNDTLWQRPKDEVSTDPNEPDWLTAPTEARVPAEELLLDATLWIRSRGVGLVVEVGRVMEWVARRPSEVPRRGAGPATEEQLELADRPDMARRLRNFERRDSRMSWPAIFLTLLLLASLGGIVYLGFQEEQRWQTAPVVPGTVVAVEPGASANGQDVYVVEYRDAQGIGYRTRWTMADVYVPPAVGDTLEVRYLPESPDRPLGPFALRNVGMVNYIPWLAVTMVAYTVLLTLVRRRR